MKPPSEEEFKAHIYGGISEADYPAFNKSQTRLTSKKSTAPKATGFVPKDVAGLHAYSDDLGAPGTLLPEGVTLLGYIGPRDRVHIIHWSRGSKTKFSTMMPLGMSKEVSYQYFSEAMYGKPLGDGTLSKHSSYPAAIGDYYMGKKGDTVYPYSDDSVEIKLKKLRITSLPRGDRRTLEDNATLDDVYRALCEKSCTLEDIASIYTRLVPPPTIAPIAVAATAKSKKKGK